jgi:hypothetical protein
MLDSPVIGASQFYSGLKAKQARTSSSRRPRREELSSKYFHVIHYVIHSCCSYSHSLAARSGDQLHDGRAYSHSAGGRHRHSFGKFTKGSQVIFQARCRRKILLIMNKIISIGLLIGGVVLVIFGMQAMNSFSSDLSRFFAGSPTDKAVWMLIGGLVAAAIGLAGVLRGSTAR